jgi:hypothetical protein
MFMALNKEATQCKGRFMFQLLRSEVRILLECMMLCVGIIETLLLGGGIPVSPTECLSISSCRVDSHWEHIRASDP